MASSSHYAPNSNNFSTDDEDEHGEFSNAQQNVTPPTLNFNDIMERHMIASHQAHEFCVMYLQQQRERQAVQQAPRRKRRTTDRGRAEGQKTLIQDYFDPSPETRTFFDDQFRRRFRMRRELFLRIVEGVRNHDSYFVQKPDATGKLGFHEYQKCTAAMRVLAYGMAYDQCDEYLRIGGSTVRDSFKHFITSVIAVFGKTYLRRATPEDVERLLQQGRDRGFPGMLGSIDCMHWEWKNCPKAWHGQFAGRSGKPTIILEAVASKDLHIWHTFFGVPGTCNDINVLDRSPVFDELLKGKAPPSKFHANGNLYKTGYYLTDGIYPEWATFMPAIRVPVTDEDRHFTMLQESYRKDVERAFGVLQARFHIIRNPVHMWDIQAVSQTMLACIILHNMIIEDERMEKGPEYDPAESVANLQDEEQWDANHARRADFTSYVQRRAAMRDRTTHRQLQADLVQHAYKHFH